MKTRWTLAAPDAGRVAALRQELGVSELLARLLVNRRQDDPATAHRFLHPSLDHLHDPFLMLGMERAVARLLEAIARGETILIYGDYDVDGATSVIVLRKAIELLGGHTQFHIPHRITEGYGMREDVLDRAVAEGVGLVVSVDTGIRAGTVVEHANSLGLDCIITDHHLPEATLPPAVAVLNPKQPGCPYPDKNLSGAGVAFKLADGLFRRRCDDATRHRYLESFLKIVAIGTIADVVPLIGENRVIAHFGLEGLRRPKHPGLKALIRVAGLDDRAISSGDVGFRIAPRLNAAGRMDTALEVIRLFESDGEEVTQVAERLNSLNEERQRAEEHALVEIEERLKDQPELLEQPAWVLEGEGWHRGVVGIVAGRLLERYHRPVLVLSCEGQEAGGSGRSISAFHLLDALDAIQAETPGFFSHYGGHAVAVGCTLERARVPELRARLLARAQELLHPSDLESELTLDASLRFPDLTPALLDELEQLAPHGMGNPGPLLGARDLELARPPRIFKEKHLGLALRQDQFVLEAMAWRHAEWATGLGPGSRVAIAFHPERSFFNGERRLRLIVRDLRVQIAQTPATG
jgi:single-stranded-DNA-specific exonuclease